MTKTPDTVAFKDDFTKDFMGSSKEVKDGYYLFKSKTDGYTMLFPVNAAMDKSYYEKHGNNYEAIYYGADNESNNTTYFVETTYEDTKMNKNPDVNLSLLSDSLHYKGDYKKISYNENEIYYAKQKYYPSKKDNPTYFFFSYIKSKRTNQAARFTYAIKCMEGKKCTVNEDHQEEKAKMLMKSIKFIF